LGERIASQQADAEQSGCEQFYFFHE
jgi:hypothetical protein